MTDRPAADDRGTSPDRGTADDRLADELLALELALARRDPTGLDTGLAGLLDPEFVEFGSSGRVWDRASIVAVLVGSAGPADIAIDEFRCDRLGDDVALVTYQAGHVSPDGQTRQARRSSLWIRRADGWRIRFHQGTPIPGG